MPASNKPPATLQEASPASSIESEQAKLQQATPIPSIESEQAKPQQVISMPSVETGRTGHRQAQPVPEQHSLFFPQQAGAVPRKAIPARQLWLSIYLPTLPLEVLEHTEAPCAVFEDQQGIRKVMLANASAQSMGIGPGLSVNAALALLPTLLLEERSPRLEAEMLQELAAWAEKFTSFVCIAAPSLLLLEIAGSLKLFDGLKALRQRIDSGFKRQGFNPGIAIAPTPLAATWFARAGARVCIQDTTNLAGKLGPLPLVTLDWPESVIAALKGMGITCIGECLRLPRQGFAKRFGACRLLELDRALGRLPDPRVSYRAPERFSADYELNEEQTDSDLLLNACESLLEKLERFLLTRQVAVQHIQFSFFHLQNPTTCLTLGCVQADRAVQHWSQLLKLKLERLELNAAVIAIHLRSGKSETFSAKTGVLPFNKQAQRQQNAPITHLAERLSARIGDASVHGVMTVAEHRPQYAWRRRDANEEIPHCAAAPDYQHNQTAGLSAEIQRNNSLILRRPLWMLREPRLLTTLQGMPVCEGVLQLQSGPERLETGWWDGDGIARDYFVARNPQGVHLWVFRNRSGKGDVGAWYLEGMFG
jgi:protein ImuB